MNYFWDQHGALTPEAAWDAAWAAFGLVSNIQIVRIRYRPRYADALVEPIRGTYSPTPAIWDRWHALCGLLPKVW